MKHRFHHPGPLEEEQVIALIADERHHAARVLRVRAGEEVEVFDSRGRNFDARVAAVGPDGVAIQILRRLEDREPLLDLHLAIALIQPEKFELVLQKGTELGVRRFTPLLTERCEVRADRAEAKRERWEKIVMEAVKQSGRSRVPALGAPRALPELLDDPGTKIVFDLDRRASELPPALEEVTLIVGPEGGLADDEIDLAVSRGAHVMQLGPRRLRAETAAIAAVTIAASKWSWPR